MIDLKRTLKKNLEGFRKISPELVGREDYIADRIEEEVKKAILEESKELQELFDWVSDKAYNKEIISLLEWNQKINSFNIERNAILGEFNK